MNFLLDDEVSSKGLISFQWSYFVTVANFHNIDQFQYTDNFDLSDDFIKKFINLEHTFLVSGEET